MFSRVPSDFEHAKVTHSLVLTLSIAFDVRVVEGFIRPYPSPIEYSRRTMTSKAFVCAGVCRDVEDRCAYRNTLARCPVVKARRFVSCSAKSIGCDICSLLAA